MTHSYVFAKFKRFNNIFILFKIVIFIKQKVKVVIFDS